MFSVNKIPPPLLFNPLKHHLGFIREYIGENLKGEKQTDDISILRDLRHLGGSLMDIYSGNLSKDDVAEEVLKLLKVKKLSEKENFLEFIGQGLKDFKTITLSDGSRWVLKYYKNDERYVHLFPARYSPYSFRVKANTLKSAILYIICIGKDFITEEDLNMARAVSGLSPVKDVVDAEAITEMIDILRVRD